MGKKRRPKSERTVPVQLARVLHEDDDLMTLEVIKNRHRELRLEDGDRFLTLVFTHGVPWERD